MDETFRAYRLTKAQYAPGLDGEGARIAPGRWNPRGRAMVYCAASPSLAVLETFVHLPPVMRRADAFPPCVMVTVEIDVAQARFATPPDGLDLAGRRNWGADWLDGQDGVAVLLPSHVLPLENNVLLNPLHPDIATAVRLVSTEPFAYDPRMGS